MAFSFPEISLNSGQINSPLSVLYFFNAVRTTFSVWAQLSFNCVLESISHLEYWSGYGIEVFSNRNNTYYRFSCSIIIYVRRLSQIHISHDRNSVHYILFNLYTTSPSYTTLKVLHSICQQIWKIQQWQQDWKRSIFIPIPKKGNPKECSNYHTIALISHVSKVMLKILQARL